VRRSCSTTASYQEGGRHRSVEKKRGKEGPGEEGNSFFFGEKPVIWSVVQRESACTGHRGEEKFKKSANTGKKEGEFSRGASLGTKKQSIKKDAAQSNEKRDFAKGRKGRKARQKEAWSDSLTKKEKNVTGSRKGKRPINLRGENSLGEKGKRAYKTNLRKGRERGSVPDEIPRGNLSYLKSKWEPRRKEREATPPPLLDYCGGIVPRREENKKCRKEGRYHLPRAVRGKVQRGKSGLQRVKRGVKEENLEKRVEPGKVFLTRVTAGEEEVGVGVNANCYKAKRGEKSAHGKRGG